MGDLNVGLFDDLTYPERRQSPWPVQSVGEWIKVTLARGYLRLRQEGHLHQWIRDLALCVMFLVMLLILYILLSS